MKSQSLPSYSLGAQDKPLLAMTIGQAFDQTAARYPEGEALVVRHQQRRFTWAQLAQAVETYMPERFWPWGCKPVIDLACGHPIARSGLFASLPAPKLV